ncbi:39S ribosomal protein L39, mitochondrial-like [Limulus polyphemus]|uniref:39S ribosomal protein L39, mitochondrial-like n=1 Tax=Limulus polyphemus TaxID=6850 RepID=A0ABM1BT21_LIMPO|nr:39S ribosomal protein L39, mitochondrial-like [Limulus polyphemus]
MVSKLKAVHSFFSYKYFSGYSILSRPLGTVTNSEVRKKRNAIFNKEKERQQALITRVEKIEVRHEGTPENCTLMMNRNISTPYNCALHISEMLTQRSVLAEVNGKLWDMHRPLEEDCTLRFLHFKIEDPFQVNKAFWRSCSFLLGLVLEKSLKDEFYVELHSWPKPIVRSGSFVYDVDLKLGNWVLKQDELSTLSLMMRKLRMENFKFEWLKVDQSVALKMFEDNRYKTEQIPTIASRSSVDNSVTVYRVQDHIDISGGPMISNTSQLGRVQVTAAHPLATEQGILYRFQGVALPSQLLLNSFAFDLLADRAKKLNTSWLPGEPITLEQENRKQQEA